VYASARKRRHTELSAAVKPADHIAPMRAAKYCDQHVCISVCPLACLEKAIRPDFTSFMLPVAVARSSSNDNAILYVLPVLWMTSCFHITGHISHLRL